MPFSILEIDFRLYKLTITEVLLDARNVFSKLKVTKTIGGSYETYTVWPGKTDDEKKTTCFT
jgi:hypothetical protein